MVIDNAPGIYTITSPSGNFYIGSSKNIRRRWWQHRTDLKAQKHINPMLQSAWNKYQGQLVFEVMFNCDEIDLLYYEQICLDQLKPVYNICTEAARAVGNKSRLGRPHSEATKQKQSLARKGIKYSDETIQKMRDAKKGRKLSPELIENIRKFHTGRKNSSETIERMRQAALKRWSKVV